MFKILLALHLLFAVFAIGPLVHAATTAGRGLRRSDAAAVASSARLLRVYSAASVLVVIVGLALMSIDSPFHKGKVAQFGDTWIWLSLVLWVVAMGLVGGLIVPTLRRTSTETAGAAPATALSSLTSRVAVAGGVVGLIFAGIIFLMVYQPGS